MIANSDSIAFDGPPRTALAVPGEGSLIHQSLLGWLIDNQIVLAEQWEALPERDRAVISGLTSTEHVLNALVQRHLLTRFQAEAVRKGNGSDLVLAQYRILDMIGQGGMGTVYRAEHFQLRREVAVKVMARAAEGNQRMVNRFYAEARAVARLQHPNIVTCFDAGRYVKPGPSPQHRDYFVMELIAGQDLFYLVRDKGPLPRAPNLRLVPSSRRRARRSPPARADPPRHQAVEHPRDSRLAGEGSRLRARARADTKRDRAGHFARHDRLHGARAGRRPAHGR